MKCYIKRTTLLMTVIMSISTNLQIQTGWGRGVGIGLGVGLGTAAIVNAASNGGRSRAYERGLHDGRMSFAKEQEFRRAQARRLEYCAKIPNARDREACELDMQVKVNYQ